VVKLVRSPLRIPVSSSATSSNGAGQSGVEAVLTVRDVPGKNIFGVIPASSTSRSSPKGRRCFAAIRWRRRRRRAGDWRGSIRPNSRLHDGVAAVLLPRMRLRRMPAAACQPAGQCHVHGFVKSGDSVEALARADIIVEGAFETGFVEHAYIEPEAGLRRCVTQAGNPCCTQAR